LNFQSAENGGSSNVVKFESELRHIAKCCVTIGPGF